LIAFQNFTAELKFWNAIKNGTAPMLMDRDYRCIRSRDVADLLLQHENGLATLAEVLAHDKVKDYERWRCGKYRVTAHGIRVVEE